MASLLLVTALAGTQGQAAIKEAESNATIKTIPGDGATAPVDSDNPDQPLDPLNPEEGEATGNEGALTIDYIPHLNFGNQIKIETKQMEVNLKNETTPFAQVTDKRGNGEGWTLKASLSQFTAENTGRSIRGAAIELREPEVTTSTSNVLPEDAPTAKSQTLEAGGQTKVLMTAQKDQGRATWLVKYPKSGGENSNIRFTAPAASLDAQTFYKAAITWELYDGPTI